MSSLLVYLHTTKLKHGVKKWVMRFLAKRFLWSEPHFKLAIQNHECYNNVVRISFAVPFKGRTERLNQSPGLSPEFYQNHISWKINYSGLKPN